MSMSCAGMDRAGLLVQWLSVSVMHGWRCVYEIWGIDSRADVCFRDATFSRPLHGLQYTHFAFDPTEESVGCYHSSAAFCLLPPAYCLLPTAFCLLLRALPDGRATARLPQ